MQIRINCKSYSAYGQCLHKEQKKLLRIFKRECILLSDGRKKCLLREEYPKPKCPPPPPSPPPKRIVIEGVRVVKAYRGNK